MRGQPIGTLIGVPVNHAAPARMFGILLGIFVALAAGLLRWRELRLVARVSRPPFADLDERQRAAVRLRALSQVVTAGIPCSDEAVADHLEVGDLQVDLGELGLGTSLKSLARAVVMLARLEKLSHFVEREPQTLCGLDDPQCRDSLLRVQPMTSQRALRFGDDSATLVVAQRLDVHPDRLGNLARPHRGAHADVPTSEVARAARAARTSPCSGSGSVETTMSTRPSVIVNAKVKNEQQPVSAVAR